LKTAAYPLTLIVLPSARISTGSPDLISLDIFVTHLLLSQRHRSTLD
jgi:hypothetical protein